MTWLKLKQYIERMTQEQLNQDVTIHLDSKDEFFAVDHAELCDSNEEDRLDDGHPYLVVFDQ